MKTGRCMMTSAVMLLPLLFSLACPPVAIGCAFIDSLVEDFTAASALREQIERVRELNDDPRSWSREAVDEISLTCLGCHGANATSGWNIRLYHNDNTAAGAHRIGINYTSRMLKGSRLRSLDTLDPRITLVNGQVGCVSCHNPFDPSGSHLTVPISGSQLCLSCHEM